MRRTVAAVMAVSAALAVAPALTSTAATGAGRTASSEVPRARAGAEPESEAGAAHTLRAARTVLAGAGAQSLAPAGPAGSVGAGREASLLLRDLFLARAELKGAQRRAADAVLARPTDGSSDPDGYRVRARASCAEHFCVHWVPRTADAPPSRAWVEKNLALMNRVWRHQVDTMGYRAPVRDGRRGGNAKFDVYLKELGARRLYGYCVPERRKPGNPGLASGFCVLDDDFARSQFGAPPAHSLRVTAAHEFFHAVQFAHDFREDRWLMESTATWMEERFADGVDDNRQYLPHGQVAQPGVPLDTFTPTGFTQYGNWPFFEYLRTRYDDRVVRAIWNRAGAFPGAPDRYSTQAVREVLDRRGGFAQVFGAYAGANTAPDRFYPEGGAWPAAPAARRPPLGADGGHDATFRIDHLASATVALRPGAGLTARGWRLRLAVDAPIRRTGPAAHVIVEKRNGRLLRSSVVLSRAGGGTAVVPFRRTTVRRVVVTLANASTRFACGAGSGGGASGTTYSCSGAPRDQDLRFELKARVSRG